MRRLKKISSVDVAFPPYDVHELIRKTGATNRQIQHYIRLGLIRRPNDSGRRATYNDLHASDIRRVQGMIKRGWTPAQQAELSAFPPHWRKRIPRLNDANEEQGLVRCYVEITKAIRIEWSGKRSPLQVRLMKAMITAGRAELKLQQQTAKSAVRTRKNTK